MKVIINRDDVDFGVAEETGGTQEFELSRTAEVQELPVVCIIFRSFLVDEKLTQGHSVGRGSARSAG